jgi:hypothetical protein
VYVKNTTIDIAKQIVPPTAMNGRILESFSGKPKASAGEILDGTLDYRSGNNEIDQAP